MKSENKNLPIPTPGIFTKTYTEKSGIIHIWYFNYGKFDRGPFKVEIKYPEGYESFEEQNDNLPITQQKFLNPSNNKLVGYSRAVQLGLYKPENSGDGRGRPKK